MKTCKILVSIVCLVAFINGLQAQISPVKSINDNNRIMTNPEDPSLDRSINDDAFAPSGVSYKYDYGKETGIYLDENWLPGEIKLTDGTVINDRFLRYNLYTRQIEFVVSGDTLAIANPAEIESLQIGNREFVYRKFVFDDKPVTDWLEVLVEGHYSLFLYRRIVYRYVESLSESNPETDRFFMTEKYYVTDENGDIKPLPDIRRQVINCLSAKNPGIESFIKKNKLKLSNESDMIKLIEYCNKRKTK